VILYTIQGIDLFLLPDSFGGDTISRDSGPFFLKKLPYSMQLYHCTSL